MRIGLITLALGATVLHAGDMRFGFIGVGAREFARSFNTHTYALIGNQNDPDRPKVLQVLESINDPLPDEQVVVRVGLFNARRDGYGQTLEQFASSVKKFGQDRAKCYANPLCFTKPVYSWFQPAVGNVPSDEKIQIITAIRRWKSRGVRTSNITFEIGNEPNYFVSMTPGEYAFLYRQYYNFIKAEDPTIKVAMGAFFAFELMPQDSRNQVAKLISLLGEREVASKLSPLDILMDARLFFNSITSPLPLAGMGLKAWGSYAGNRAARDVKNLLFSRFFDRTTLQYFTEVMNSLPAHIAPDIVTFHAYPADFVTTMRPETIHTIIDNLAADLRNMAYAKRPTYYPPKGCNEDTCDVMRGPEIRITETGNLISYANEEDFVVRMWNLLNYLSGQKNITHWYWYKPLGHDAQFDLIKSAMGISPPMTRLVWDADYGMIVERPLPLYPKKIPCEELNMAGTYFYYLANGWYCSN